MRARFDNLERACAEFLQVARVHEGYRPLRISTPAGIIEAVEPYCAFDPPNAWEEFTRRRGIPCYNYPILVAGISKCWSALLLILPAMLPVSTACATARDYCLRYCP